MKNAVIIIILFIVLLNSLNAQNYIVEEDNTGFNTAPYQIELNEAADILIDSLPEIYRDSFKVISAGIYIHSDNFIGEVADVFQIAIDKAQNISRYFLLIARIGNENSVINSFRIHMVLPNKNVFYCLDQLDLNLRSNLIVRIESVINEQFEMNSNDIFNFYKAEIAGMNDLMEYVSSLENCCEWQNRSPLICTSCVLTVSQFERKLNAHNLVTFNADAIIDETYIGMGEEEIGYKIISSGVTIDLDDALTYLKEEINNKYPEKLVKIYPFDFQSGCAGYDNIRHNFLTDSVDIGILFGVINEGDKKSIRWQTISDDDLALSETTFDSDTCYYFNSENIYTHKELCYSGITPRGIIKNFEGNNFDLEFTFANPEINPLTLTAGPVKNSSGGWLLLPNTEENMVNQVMILTKDRIESQLIEVVRKKNKPVPGAFDMHIFAPWSLLFGSSGFSDPFDYSAKNFFLDRENYLFITDDGEHIVAHDWRNAGNFLWGAATYILGVSEIDALIGAHLNNLVNNYDFDASDDQYSIRLGRKYSKLMGWHNKYNGKNIFRNN